MSSAVAKEKEWYLDSDGSVVNYPQIYQATAEEQVEAEQLEEYIKAQHEGIEYSFLRMGAALQLFEERKMYLARGAPTFRAWLQGSEFSFTYEHATRLIRIVRDLIPMLDGRPPLMVSVMKELLPILNDESPQDKILAAYDEVKDLPSANEAKKRLRELRGIVEPPIPTTFRARVTHGETYHSVTITRYGDDGDIYEVTDRPLKIKPKDWARWEDRFGIFIQYE